MPVRRSPGQGQRAASGLPIPIQSEERSTMRMRTFVAGHEAVSDVEFAELALGIDIDLFRGPLEYETVDELAAREDAARDVLADLVAMGEAGDEVAGWDALYADALTRTVPFLRAAHGHRSGTGEAA